MVEDQKSRAVLQLLAGGGDAAAEKCHDGLEHLVLPVMSVAHGWFVAAIFFFLAESAGEPSPQQTLVRIAIAYCDFAAENLQLWRALFEHRMATDKTVPDWSVDDQMRLFRHIYQPLAALFRQRSPEEIGITARSLFSAVHGMVALGLEQKLVAVPLPALRKEIAVLVRAMIDGLIAQPS
ncbi:TetR-like C-terminal domain-containing protein [Bradyrhizobium sp. A5]|uniref:TetR-like C-terminal domain-containing protein n=1 Tax=Bradyrhizobium sp. A5 TaxID=3133696 RepID=UPI0035C7AD42